MLHNETLLPKVRKNFYNTVQKTPAHAASERSRRRAKPVTALHAAATFTESWGKGRARVPGRPPPETLEKQRKINVSPKSWKKGRAR